MLSSALETSSTWMQAKAMSIGYIAMGVLDFPDQQLERLILRPGIGKFVRWSMAFGNRIITPSRVILFKYTYIFIFIICNYYM